MIVAWFAHSVLSASTCNCIAYSLEWTKSYQARLKVMHPKSDIEIAWESILYIVVRHGERYSYTYLVAKRSWKGS